jgi:hypothetical protein
MRYVSSIPPVSGSSTTRQLRALSPVHAVNPVHTPEQVIPYVPAPAARVHHEPTLSLVEQSMKRVAAKEDRRIFCRRVIHQTVLMELRSGIDRRRINLREGAVVDHIDETA